LILVVDADTGFIYCAAAELAWAWLRLQPGSAMTQWFSRRFASGGKRMRRVGIVALARRLAIALWRYLEHGEIPDGAALVKSSKSAFVAFSQKPLKSSS
jgi:hypothetical protein